MRHFVFCNFGLQIKLPGQTKDTYIDKANILKVKLFAENLLDRRDFISRSIGRCLCIYLLVLQNVVQDKQQNTPTQLNGGKLPSLFPEDSDLVAPGEALTTPGDSHGQEHCYNSMHIMFFWPGFLQNSDHSHLLGSGCVEVDQDGYGRRMLGFTSNVCLEGESCRSPNLDKRWSRWKHKVSTLKLIKRKRKESGRGEKNCIVLCRVVKV